MSTIITGKNGGKVVLLNPAEKGKRYARELKHGKNVNTKEELTDTQRAYRSGYLSARSDSAKCYNAQQNKQVTNKRSRNYRG